MIRAFLALGAMTAVALEPTPAAAQGRDLPNADGVMWKYAQCLVRTSGDDSRSVFSLLPHSREANTILEEMQRPRCLPRRVASLRFNHTIIRGALAEHLYERREKSKLPATVYDGEADISFGSFDQRYDFVFIRASECALSGSADLGEKVLASDVGSKQERTAMAQLAPSLSPCLDEGVDIDLTPAMFRSYIAEATLRRAISEAQSNQPEGGPDA